MDNKVSEVVKKAAEEVQKILEESNCVLVAQPFIDMEGRTRANVTIIEKPEEKESTTEKE